MKRWLSAEPLAYGLALALAAAAFGVARGFPRPEGAPSGPGTLPLLLSLALAALALAGLFLPARDSAAGGDEPVDTRRLLTLGALSVAYLLALPVLGFISATALFVACTLAALGYRKPAQALAAGFVFAFTLYGVFERLMAVTLPKGWIG
jgi:hypothetical protein